MDSGLVILALMPDELKKNCLDGISTRTRPAETLNYGFQYTLNRFANSFIKILNSTFAWRFPDSTCNESQSKGKIFVCGKGYFHQHDTDEYCTTSPIQYPVWRSLSQVPSSGVYESKKSAGQ